MTDILADYIFLYQIDQEKTHRWENHIEAIVNIADNIAHQHLLNKVRQGAHRQCSKARSDPYQRTKQ